MLVCVCVYYGHLICRWYVGSIQRYQAEQLLRIPSCSSGTFLVRERGDYSYSLSVKDTDRVRHFVLRRFENGSYFLSRKHSSFETVPLLVSAYREGTYELPVKLLQPYLSPWKPRTTDLSRQTKSNWVIPREQLRLSSRLDTNMLYEVWEGRWNQTTSVGVWTLNTSVSDGLTVDKFLHRATEMKRLCHRNLIQVYAVCVPEVFYVVTEPVIHVSMLKYLSDNRESLGVNQILYMAIQVAEVMEYLESNEFVHCRLSAINVLVDDNHIIKLTDHGMYTLSTLDFNYDFSLWSAPESILTNKYSSKSDVWSYGVLLYELITRGRRPYPGVVTNKLLESLKSGYRMECPRGCPKELYSVMIDCWKAEPSERPCFGMLVSMVESIYMNLEDMNDGTADN